MESTSYRKPTVQELSLIELLVGKSALELPSGWAGSLMVKSMDDGKMGSLYLLPIKISTEGRDFGRQVSELLFKDKDGVDVIVSLNTDVSGELFELDIWKTDFSPLIGIPDLS